MRKLLTFEEKKVFAEKNGFTVCDAVVRGARGVESFYKVNGDICTIYISETSTSWYDWQTNFSFFLCSLIEYTGELSDKEKEFNKYFFEKYKYLKKSKVHKGFLSSTYDALFSLRQNTDFEEFLKSEKPKTFQIIGVSAGGAIAIILASMLRFYAPHHILSVETYGSPSLCNGVFRKLIKEMGISIVRHYTLFDVVANMSAIYWLIGLRSVGIKRKIKPLKWYYIFRVVSNHADICDLAERKVINP